MTLKDNYDIICVLGYQFSDDWHIPVHLEHRLELVADLYRQKKAPHIGLCGKWSLAFEHKELFPPKTEASEMEKVLLNLGIPQKDIFKEDDSKDTIGNAYFLKTKIIMPHNFNKLLIACADYHAKRVEYIFHKVFGDSYTIDIITTPTTHSKDKTFTDLQDLIFKHQKEFLKSMKDGDHTYLIDKLYSDPFFQNNKKV